MTVRTPIATARGLGSSRAGVGHWKLQRLTALGNLVLLLWLVFSVASLAGTDYDTVRAWLAAPLPATLMILLVISTFYHARLGVQVVIEDYVHHEAAKVASLAATALLALGLAVACIVAVLTIAIGS